MSDARLEAKVQLLGEALIAVTDAMMARRQELDELWVKHAHIRTFLLETSRQLLRHDTSIDDVDVNAIPDTRNLANLGVHTGFVFELHQLRAEFEEEFRQYTELKTIFRIVNGAPDDLRGIARMRQERDGYGPDRDEMEIYGP